MSSWCPSGQVSFLLGVALLLLWNTAPAALPQESEVHNPHTSEADVAAGADIFLHHCAACHGESGEGGMGPDLRVRRYRHGNSDQALYRTIRRGIAGSEMLSTPLPGKEIWQLVAYLRSLTSGARKEDLPGDPERGKQLFDGKGRCAQCHWVNGRGGRLGPELSDIGSRRSSRHLRSSLLTPDEHVDPKQWQVRAIDREGEVVVGLRLHEDTFSIRLLDTKENLHSLEKNGLQEFKVLKRSLMPSYRTTLNDDELDDLIAYMSTLRGQ